ncbi:aminoglycoside phosphotransferase family protein [Actinosynnema sp. NPDC050436]|uniref:aminoglycoside phosphotransferase family protein n=1 Tax=Actinosynnema sp. NPDC050436 TaxID=3155659 RepID=UPI003407D2A3
MTVHVPDALRASHDDPEGRVWLAALPGLVRDLVDRWELRPDGPHRNGMAALVVPVTRPDGTPAVLRLQPRGEQTSAIVTGLRTWRGDGIVRLLDHDPVSGSVLLERLDATRPLSAVEDDDEALTVLAGLLRRLTSVPAPAGVRRLADIAAAMLAEVPAALPALADPADRELVRSCAAAVAEVVGEAGDRLLHWDLHYDNVLAAQREPWLAIDPEPLAGHPGFDLQPALDNRWERVDDPTKTVHRRFDLMTDELGLDRAEATAWTLGRVLQNTLWDVEDGKGAVDPVQRAIAEALMGRPG